MRGWGVWGQCQEGGVLSVRPAVGSMVEVWGDCMVEGAGI